VVLVVLQAAGWHALKYVISGKYDQLELSSASTGVVRLIQKAIVGVSLAAFEGDLRPTEVGDVRHQDRWLI
jgi:hypothetical protein